MRPGYFRLTRIAPSPPPMLASQAFITCALCGQTIDSIGGPLWDAVCTPCGEALIGGRLRGLVTPDPETAGS